MYFLSLLDKEGCEMEQEKDKNAESRKRPIQPIPGLREEKFIFIGVLYLAFLSP